jgi:hypothetical protein
MPLVTRLLEAPLPFPENDRAGVFPRGWWPLDWLDFPAATPSVVAYRLRLDLDSAAAFRLHVSAGERYRLFVDGEEAGVGPERGDLANWRLDAYQLDLPAGPHWLAVEVSALGARAPKWQVPIPPGLLVVAEEPFAKQLSTGHAPWEAAPLEAVSFVHQAPAFFTGPRAVIVGDRYPWTWTTGGGTGFTPAPRARRGVCGGRPGSDFMPPRLVPAGLPLPSQLPLPKGSVVLVDAPPPPAGPAAEQPRADPAAHLATEVPAWQAWLDHDTPLVLPRGLARRVLVDLGTYRAAWPLLLAEGAGGLVRLRFAEALHRHPRNGDPLNDHMKGDRRLWQNGLLRGLGPDFQTTPEAREFRAYEWECGRWLELTAVAGPDAPLTLRRLRLLDTSFPFVDEGSLACDQAALEQTRALCVHTLRVGTHGHYCDCPAYERLQYIGDTRLQILATYCLTRDDRLPSRALDDFAGARLADGLLPARHPASGTQSIPPFSLWWIGILHDATFWRDPPGRLARLLPVARGVLDAWWLHRAADGLVQDIPGWNFVDWALGWTAGMPPGADRGPSSVLNWHLVHALRTTASLEALAGEPELARLHHRRADQIVAALDATCWDETRGLYLDTPGHPSASEHAQILALLAGLSGPRRERVAAALVSVPDLTRSTIYFSHYLFEALRLLGRGDLIWRALGLWFDLPALGFTTTPERPEPSRSDCHPWGAHPLYHIVATLAGLRPAARGFSAVELAPLVNIPLRRLALTVPHPRGELVLDLHRPACDAAWQGTLRLPAGVTAVVPPGIVVT